MNTVLRLRLICGGLLLAGALLVGQAFDSRAQSSGLTAQDIQNLKIDMAGRQRMLSQRIAKAACFIGTFSQTDYNLDILRDARDLFISSHKTLKYGNPQIGIPPEDNADILDGLNKLEKTWMFLEFSSSLLLESPEFPGLDIDLIAEHNLETLRQAAANVEMMDQLYSAASQVSDERLISAINVAGRQRMLTQRGAKEFCFIHFGLNPQLDRDRLRVTLSDFEQGLNDLENGNPERGIPPAPNLEIVEMITETRQLWRPFRTILIKTIDGVSISASEFDLVARKNDEILIKSNELVQKFIEIAQEQAPSP